jgi:hypothetical protein
MELLNREAQRALGNLTPAAFLKLPREAREKVYVRRLVKEGGHVLIEEGDDEDFFNPEIERNAILRQACLVGGGEVGSQIAEEAREVYYTRNTFEVRSHWLKEFLWDCLAHGRPESVDHLIRRIVVQVDLRHIYEDGFGESNSEDEDGDGDMDDNTRDHQGSGPGLGKGKGEKNSKAKATQAVRDLRLLFKLRNPEWVHIAIHGGGSLDGSDLGTQLKIQEISKVVKKLLEWFPGRLKIRKVLSIEGQRQRFGADLTVYWQPPTKEVKERVRRGVASFQDVMQVQIETWTRVIPQTITASSMYQEYLL